jgi:F-type H+-transporting ATPase subunit a
VAEPKKRGCLGCSFPIIIIVAIVVLALVVVGFLSGSLGQKMLGVDMPDWLVPETPEPHLAAPVLFNIGPLGITNTLLATWLTVIFLVLISWLVTRRMQLVPRRFQVAFEALLGWVYDLCTSVAGEVNGRRFFPVICTIFLFVLFNAWLSLLPGFISFEYREYTPVAGHEQEAHADGHEAELVIVEKDGVEMIEHKKEILRGANTDVNTPLAIALVSFVFVIFYGMKSLGVGFWRQYFNFGGLFGSIGKILTGKFKAGLSGVFSGAVDAFVGLLEFVSLWIRNISFTFRLFGNMTAGEILLLIAVFLMPMVIALPFYGLEILVGFVQAFIFSGLTLVFATMAVTSHDAESH